MGKLFLMESLHKAAGFHEKRRRTKEKAIMHEVLRQRLIRRLESLPEAQLYQVLDYIEFLESKYARSSQVEPSVLQRFAEGVEDKLRKKAINPATLREAFQLIAAADRVLSDVSSAGKQILDELGGLGETPPPRRQVPASASRRPGTGRGTGAGTRGPGAPGGGEGARGRRPPPGDAPREVGLGDEWTPDGDEGSGGP